MNGSKEKKPKKNVAERYKEYVYDWFGVEINPEEPEVVIPQWKFYRLARIHRQQRESLYAFFLMFVGLLIIMLWYGTIK